MPDATDVLVVGSVGAALVAAIRAHDAGARVRVLERSAFVGGTTAVSGGGIWIPGNHHMADVGAAHERRSLQHADPGPRIVGADGGDQRGPPGTDDQHVRGVGHAPGR